MAQKGAPKTGGRKKGTPNKQTQELKEIADKLGVDPFEVLLRFAGGDWKSLGYPKGVYIGFFGEKNPTIDPAVRVKAAAEACNYLFPKRKAVELSNPDGSNLHGELTDEQLEMKIQSLLSKRK